jgi:hypothetical protein
VQPVVPGEVLVPRGRERIAAVHRTATTPVCQLFTRRIRSRAAECSLSMMFVVPRQRRSRLGSPNRLIVDISSSPSRRDAAASGHRCSSPGANCSRIAVSTFASSLVMDDVAVGVLPLLLGTSNLGGVHQEGRLDGGPAHDVDEVVDGDSGVGDEIEHRQEESAVLGQD